MRLFYGAVCERCGEAVEYADITSHPCSEQIRREVREREANPRKRQWRFDPFWHHRDS